MTQDYEQKYDEAVLATGRRLQPGGFAARLQQRDALDPHFTRLWLDFMHGLARRQVLDERTRLLVQVGQFTVARAGAFLEDAMTTALTAGVPAREVLEVILQCVVYGGNVAVDPALAVFERVAQEQGRVDDLRDARLPLDGRDSSRSLADEQTRWHPDDLADPRLAGLMARHGGLGISSGLLVRPREHLNVLAYIDALDPDFALLWERYVYQGLYGRGILDDRTRILCIIGNCVALGEGTQIRNHIRSAFHAGVTPREALEVILQSCLHFGMPPTMQALAIFYGVVKDENRLAEIGDPPFPQREHGR